MKKNILSVLNYIPPPPPPPPSSSKRFSKTLIAALVIVLAVVAVAGAYYVTTLPANNNNNLLPSASSSVSPSATHSSTTSTASSSSPTTSPHSSTTSTSTSSATATPSSSGQTSVGYRAGAWANYTVKNYDASGAVTARYNLGYTVDEGPMNGVDCWVLQTDLEFSSGGDVMKTITAYWLDKSSLQGLHYKILISLNDTVISNTENDYSPGDFNNIPTAIDPNMVISKESITVPAGTFNCDKAATTTTDLGNTYVTTVWGNSNIPVISMVKQELASNGVLITSTELVAYGG